MSIMVQIIDEAGNLIKEIGAIEDIDLAHLIHQAEMNDMKCLSFINIAGDTIFNEKQLHQIKEELSQLKGDKYIKSQTIKIIQSGITEALKDIHLYLKFEGE